MSGLKSFILYFDDVDDVLTTHCSGMLCYVNVPVYNVDVMSATPQRMFGRLYDSIMEFFEEFSDLAQLHLGSMDSVARI